jgi:excisionase family DNA binding protein
MVANRRRAASVRRRPRKADAARPVDGLGTHELLTVAEVGRYFRVTRRTVYRLAAAGTIPSVKVGHQWRFRRSALDAWLMHKNGGRS